MKAIYRPEGDSAAKRMWYRTATGQDGEQDDFVGAATAVFKDVAVAVEENEVSLRSLDEV